MKLYVAMIGISFGFAMSCLVTAFIKFEMMIGCGIFFISAGVWSMVEIMERK